MPRRGAMILPLALAPVQSPVIGRRRNMNVAISAIAKDLGHHRGRRARRRSRCSTLVMAALMIPGQAKLTDNLGAAKRVLRAGP